MNIHWLSERALCLQNDDLNWTTPLWAANKNRHNAGTVRGEGRGVGPHTPSPLPLPPHFWANESMRPSPENLGFSLQAHPFQTTKRSQRPHDICGVANAFSAISRGPNFIINPGEDARDPLVHEHDPPSPPPPPLFPPRILTDTWNRHSFHSRSHGLVLSILANEISEWVEGQQRNVLILLLASDSIRSGSDGG